MSSTPPSRIGAVGPAAPRRDALDALPATPPADPASEAQRAARAWTPSGARSDTSVSRGASRPGRERHLADKAFTAVTRTLCEIDDGSPTDGTDADDNATPVTATISVTLDAWCGEAPAAEPVTEAAAASAGAVSPAPATPPGSVPGRAVPKPTGTAMPQAPKRVEPLTPLGRTIQPPDLLQRKRHGRAVVFGLMVAVAVIAFVMKFMHHQERGTSAGNEVDQKKQARPRGR